MARRRFVPVASIAVALLAASFLTLRPAAAHEVEGADATHEGYGVFTVEARHPGAGGTIHYVVRLTWSADGHPANGASVAATAISPAGVSHGAVVLQPLDADGRYGGTVTMPSAGWWTVQLVSATPAGSLTFYDHAMAA